MMSTRRVSANTTVLYFIGVVVIVVAFLQLGGGAWVKGILHGNQSMASWNWVQILVSLAIGLVIGWGIARRR